MPPKQSQQVVRSHTMDLRPGRNHIPRGTIQGDAIPDDYVPAAAQQKIKRIKSEAKKRGFTVRKRKVPPMAVDEPVESPTPGPSAPLTASRAAPRLASRSVSRQASRSVSRQPSRSVSRSMSRSVSRQPSREPSRSISRQPSLPALKRVRFEGHIQSPLAASSVVSDTGSYNTVGEEEEESDELEEDTSEESEELGDTVNMPLSPISRPSRPLQTIQRVIQPPQRPAAAPTSRVRGSSILDQSSPPNPSSDPVGAVEYEEQAGRKVASNIRKFKRAREKRLVSENKRDYMNARMEFNEGDELETSEVEEELGLVLQASNFDIQLFLHIRIDGKIAIRRALGNTTRRSFNIADFEEEVLEILTRHIDGTNFEITKITAAMKHESGRGGSLYQDIEFSIIVADEMMTLIEQKRSNFRKGNMVITFEMLAKQLQKQASDRAPSVLPGGFIRSSPPPPTSDDATSQPPANRSTVRASRLQEEHVARVEAIRTAGTFQRQLMDRWRCTEDNCTNKDNFCWPDPSNRLLHYNITTPQHETWSNAIASGTATLLNPPASLLTYWIREQGPISRDSRQPIKQSAAQENRLNMTGMLEMQQKMQEFMMQTRMMDQMELMEEKQERREERIERRQHIRDQRDRDREMLASLAYKVPTEASIQPSATPQSIPINFSTPLASRSAPPPTPTPTDRTSSPINSNIEDGDLIHQFFEWKIINTRLAERRVKWEHAREVVVENEWSIKDLYEMEDYKSVMYDRAIQAKIPDGLARRFREELRAFKPVYRRLRATDFMAAESLRELSTALS